MDMVATIAARRHAGTRVATVGVHEVRFLKPIRVGQLLVCKAKVNRVFGSSMEVGVKVWAEDTYANSAYHACSGYLTFVALGEDGRPKRVPDVAIRTEEERRRWTQAGERRRLHTGAEREGRENMAHGEK